jgi:L-histidine N-alpha-methyltransferase
VSTALIDIHVGDGTQRTLHDDVLDGLTRPSKELPPKHLYDTYGSELFDRITELPEYYPTRAEREILTSRAGEIVAATQMGELVELGSGTATKTRVLLDAATEAGVLRRYVPFDVAESVVRESVGRLGEDYPGLELHGIVGDFERHLGEIPPPEPGRPRVLAFLGGTIGNFLPGTRRKFLRSLGRQLRPEDRILLGTDLVKDPAVLEAAYNDSAGVTAAFNRNVLAVMNRELDADFDLEAFEHVAFYDREQEWIEMRLRAVRPMDVHIAKLGLDVHFAAREELRTEISAKFTRERLEADLRAAGLVLDQFLTDDDELFALSLIGAAPAR